MWTSLFHLNRDPLLRELDTLIENLTEFRDALGKEDLPRVRALLEKGRALREDVLYRQHQNHVESD